jgi:hypothetical protein
MNLGMMPQPNIMGQPGPQAMMNMRPPQMDPR